MQRKFQTLDVFTERRFGGNPLAVVIDSEGLSGDDMQRIAREFNLSETIFLLEARDRHPANVYESYDGQRLPLSDRSVDFALTVCVIHHVPVVQWQSFVDEMRRVVRPGGFICIIEHNPLNPLTRLGVARCAFDADAVLLGKARTEALMRQSGIVDVETRYFLLSPFAVRPLQAIERAFARLPLGGQYLTLGMVR